MKLKIKYPKTPRDKWAHVKVKLKDHKRIKALYLKGISPDLIGKKFGISRSGVRLIADPRFKRLHDTWSREHPESHRLTPETRQRVYKRKLKHCGKLFRNYHNQFKKKKHEKAHMEK